MENHYLCPHCRGQLKVGEYIISRIAGERSTYQVSEEGIHATGEHSYRYTHFKMSDQFIQYLKG